MKSLRRRRGIGGIGDWYSGRDAVARFMTEEVRGDADALALYGTGYKRGIIVGAGTVGVIWAGFIAWYMWKK